MKKIIALTLCFVLALSLVSVATGESHGEVLYNRLLEMVEFLKLNHIDATEDDDPIHAGLIKMFDEYPEMYPEFVNFMFQSYDDYSYYMQADDYSNAYDYTTYIGGIGISMEVCEDGTYITDVLADSAAEEAGLLAGDKLIKADGVSLEGFTTEMIGEIIRGPVGTAVDITVLRDGAELSFSITRYAMEASAITASLVDDSVAYIKLDYFGDIGTYMEFASLYKSLPEQGVKTVILDLRNNPGGMLDVAINTIERMIPDKNIPYLMYEMTNPRRVKTYTSLGLGWDATKMVILVNEKTASCAEIVAGALQDLGYATVVGTTTYGKGTGQLHAQVYDTDFAVVSSCRFSLPTSGVYEGVGIIPDVNVKMGSEYYHLPKLAAILENRDVYIGTSSNALALEQRLHELGYFSAEPDNVADGATFLAVNRFQRDNKLYITRGFCDIQTLKAINRAAIELDGTPIPIDTQYERALSIAKSYAKNDTKPSVVDMSKITFGE